MISSPSGWPAGKIVVIGFGVTGRALARVAQLFGAPLTVIEDRPSEEAVALAEGLGVTLIAAPSPSELFAHVADAELVVVSPGVAPSHPVFAIAAREQLVSEVELAGRIATVPIVAITGTNGKTTVTTLVDEMLRASGLRSTAAGNIGPTLIEAVVRDDLDVIVAELSSFQLALTQRFCPRVATWLNFAEDHLDWHPTMEDYADAKSRIFSNQGPSDIAVVNAREAMVMERAARARSRVVTFGDDRANYRVESAHFVRDAGEDLGEIALLPRQLPHDIDNALAALASALEAGATIEGCARALSESVVLAHRVELIAESAGVSYFDDSKATTPAAVVAALGAFPSVVLIAGGRNKGLDLSPLRRFFEGHTAHELHGVIGIGEAGPMVAALFADLVPAVVATSMDEAVRLATDLAKMGDAVLLSPGCASFDWYGSYAERGADFAHAVRALIATGGAQ